jgi:hypothetical protein
VTRTLQATRIGGTVKRHQTAPTTTNAVLPSETIELLRGVISSLERAPEGRIAEVRDPTSGPINELERGVEEIPDAGLRAELRRVIAP